MTYETNRLAGLAEVRVTGLRYCHSCQARQPASSFRKPKHGRERCGACYARTVAAAKATTTTTGRKAGGET